MRIALGAEPGVRVLHGLGPPEALLTGVDPGVSAALGFRDLGRSLEYAATAGIT